jgi:hypothetical protein
VRRLLPVAALVALTAAAPAVAQLFPTRGGESGLLDVPDAETVPRGLGLFGAELRYDHRESGPNDFGALPLYVVGGFAERLETGLSMRQWGQPGDELPERVYFGAAAKYQLLAPTLRVPGLAVDVTGDRLNAGAVLGSRLIFSTAARGTFRVAAFVGGEFGHDPGVTWGGALSAALSQSSSVVLEALGGPRGKNYGTAVRWRASASTSMFVALNYLPDDKGLRLSVGFGWGSRQRPVQPGEEAAAATPAEAAAKAPSEIAFLDERPHFRLKLRISDPTSTDPRSLRHGPWTPSVAAAASTRPTAAPGARGVAPSLEDLAEAQLREQEALADARERRIRATSEQLDGREKAIQDETRRLAERERDLYAREQQLDARERRLGKGGTPSQQQRDLEALEAQLAAQERTLSAQERSYAPPIDAAQGRERDAAAREDAERGEANRLAASVSGAGTRAQQGDVRKQALGARNRQLAALEARLVARGERIDAQERQLRTRAERMDTWQRRLDARSERLDVVEKRAAEPKAAGAAAAAAAGAAAVAPKDKAVFVMVVKSPTAIVKERAGTPAAPGAAALAQGTAVEKAVAAATVVTFASPTAQLSELDRETIDNIAKLAAREHCELLIWARAKDPGLMSEAQRRAAEIKTRVLAAAPLAERQVVTRITTRPGAQGVDVVVSALRETAKPVAAAPAVKAGQLEQGEAGKRQVREAVQAAQPSIEACVGDLMEQKKLPRAEGSLKLTISAAGKVTKVLAGDGDLAGPGLSECLGAASGGWTFPPSDAEYVVDVPITVIRGGTSR